MRPRLRRLPSLALGLSLSLALLGWGSGSLLPHAHGLPGGAALELTSERADGANPRHSPAHACALCRASSELRGGAVASAAPGAERPPAAASTGAAPPVDAAPAGTHGRDCAPRGPPSTSPHFA